MLQDMLFFASISVSCMKSEAMARTINWPPKDGQV